MGGEGAISGMIASIKDNRKLLSRHKQRRKDAYNVLRDTSATSDIKLDLKKLTPEELENIRIKGKEERRKANMKLALFSLIFIAIGILLLVMFLKYLGI